MNTKEHIAAQRELFTKLEADTAWLLSERLGYDCHTTADGRRQLNLELARIITQGFGAWAAEHTTKTETSN